MLDPTPELPVMILLISDVEFPSRIRNGVGGPQAYRPSVRCARHRTTAMLSFQDLGKGSVTHLRETLGLPSTDGVRPVGLGLKAKGK